MLLSRKNSNQNKTDYNDEFKIEDKKTFKNIFNTKNLLTINDIETANNLNNKPKSKNIFNNDISKSPVIKNI